MKSILMLTSFCLFSLVSTRTDATVVYTQIPGVYSTGVDDQGHALPEGAVDPHYSLTASPLGAGSAMVTPVYWPWLGATAGSAWINNTGTLTNAPVGNYVYTLTFSLNGLVPSTASISGEWVSDNVSQILLNGTATGYTHTSPYEFSDLNAFTLTSGFVTGQNTLSFLVNNQNGGGGNPTGLQVQIVSATAAVPEPTSFSMLGLLGSLLLVWRKRGHK